MVAFWLPRGSAKMARPPRDCKPACGSLRAIDRVIGSLEFPARSIAHCRTACTA
jgi:hypothetical protein